MATALLESTDQETRYVIPILVIRGREDCKIFWGIEVQNGDKFVSLRKVYGWVGKFQGKRMNVDADYAHYDPTSTVTCWG
jgi:hypothetical protein